MDYGGQAVWSHFISLFFISLLAHLLCLFRRMQQRCLAVSSQKHFIDYELPLTFRIHRGECRMINLNFWLKLSLERFR